MYVILTKEDEKLRAVSFTGVAQKRAFFLI